MAVFISGYLRVTFDVKSRGSASVHIAGGDKVAACDLASSSRGRGTARNGPLDHAGVYNRTGSGRNSEQQDRRPVVPEKVR